MSRSEMSRIEMERGFAEGRGLTQEEWSSAREITDVDALIAEGKAEIVKPWGFHDGFQCRRRVVRGRATTGTDAEGRG